jgi:hypothetical protein
MTLADDACRRLEAIIRDDLEHATVSSAMVLVEEDGRIYFDEIILRLEDGRKVAIVPEMRGMCPWLSLEVNTGRGWRNMSVAEDYAEELEELTAAPWHPEPDTLEEARL